MSYLSYINLGISGEATSLHSLICTPCHWYHSALCSQSFLPKFNHSRLGHFPSMSNSHPLSPILLLSISLHSILSSRSFNWGQLPCFINSQSLSVNSICSKTLSLYSTLCSIFNIIAHLSSLVSSMSVTLLHKQISVVNSLGLYSYSFNPYFMCYSFNSFQAS